MTIERTELIVRFLRKVEFTDHRYNGTPCLEWTGGKNSAGKVVKVANTILDALAPDLENEIGDEGPGLEY